MVTATTTQRTMRRPSSSNNNNKRQNNSANKKQQSGTLCKANNNNNNSNNSGNVQRKCRRRFGVGGGVDGVKVASAPSLSLGLWLLPVLLVLLAWQQQPCEGRYLPTRSHGDDLDKLRELMLQILESSNEDQRPPNEANGNTLAQRASWLNKLNGLDGLESQKKYGSRGGLYDNGRYY